MTPEGMARLLEDLRVSQATDAEPEFHEVPICASCGTRPGFYRDLYCFTCLAANASLLMSPPKGAA